METDHEQLAIERPLENKTGTSYITQSYLGGTQLLT